MAHIMGRLKDLLQIHTDIMGQTGVPFRVLVELLLAVLTAEGVFGIPVGTPEPDLIVIHDCETNGICRHSNSASWYTIVFRH